MGQELKPLIFDCEPCTYLFQLSKIFRNYVTSVLASLFVFFLFCPFVFPFVLVVVAQVLIGKRED